MSPWTLIRRSLRFHARLHLGVVLGATIGSAALIGALIVGDSVRESLRERALARLGPIAYAMPTGDLLFGDDLPERLGAKRSIDSIQVGSAILRSSTIRSGMRSSAMVLPGTVARQDGTARANHVNVLGVETNGWPLLAAWASNEAIFSGRNWLGGLIVQTDTTGASGTWTKLMNGIQPQWEAGGIALINQTLANQLSVRPGDAIVVRVQKPTALAMDAVIAPRSETAVALRFTVGPILPAELLGDFSLSANQVPPANLFLPLAYLSQKLGVPGRANLLVSSDPKTSRQPTLWEKQKLRISSWLWGHGLSRRRHDWELGVRLDQPVGTQSALAALSTALDRAWRLEDAQLSVRAIEQPQTVTGGEYIQPVVELNTSRIFLEDNIVTAALTPRTHALSGRPAFEGDNTNDVAFSQFVTNGVGVLTYLVNLIQAGEKATPYSMVTAAGPPFTPGDLGDNEILVNEWLAEDLQLRPGAPLTLSYYIVDSASRLIERTNSFRVRGIVPLRGMYADRSLMPEFPGLAKAESTQNWDAGFPLIYTIRDKDEAYWKAHRGTPKAFISLAAGQRMWTNRFGTLTSVRYLVPTNSFPSTYRELVYRNLMGNLNPADLGLGFQAVREQALQSADQAQDFGQLFLGFSVFLVVSALVLMALLFQFSLEQRSTEVGTLLALGFRPMQIRRLFLFEAAALALIGAVLGALGGVFYAKGMLWGLTTIWRSAVGDFGIQFYASRSALFIGILTATLLAVITIWVTLRKQGHQPIYQLLAIGASEQASVPGQAASWRRKLDLVLGLFFIAAACGIAGWVLSRGDRSNAEAFFSAGACLLIGGLLLGSAGLRAIAQTANPTQLTIGRVGIRGCARRRTRSLATIALLACGSFLILAIGVFRLDANQDATHRSSGTGGFGLIGESALPVVQDLNTPAGREFFGLGANDLGGVLVVPFRVRPGDEASCLNLNRAQKPRLLGAKPELLGNRFTFTSVARGFDIRKGWDLLRVAPQDVASDEVPAVGDANSIEWSLGKRVGDTLEYTDEHGHTVKLRLVGAIANSVLQGSLVIDEAEFVRRFPSQSGYRFFLLDLPHDRIAQISPALSRALQDYGLELTSATRRLNAFNAVQNTYLGTFQVLGGLGLLLGSAGLGIVVLRNMLERRAELGLLVAVGFRRRMLQQLVLSEHGALLVFGLGVGLTAAAVAVLPNLLAPTLRLPYGSLGLTLLAVLLNGLLCAWLATRYALRGNLLDALRNE